MPRSKSRNTVPTSTPRVTRAQDRGMAEASEFEPDVTESTANQSAYFPQIADIYKVRLGAAASMADQGLPAAEVQCEKSRLDGRPSSPDDTLVENERTVRVCTTLPSHYIPPAPFNGAQQQDVPMRRNSTASQGVYKAPSQYSGTAEHTVSTQSSSTPDSATANKAAVPSDNTLDVASILLSLQQQMAKLNATVVAQSQQAAPHASPPRPVSEPVAVPRVEQQAPQQAPHQLSPEWRRSAHSTYNPTQVVQEHNDREVPTQSERVGLLVSQQENKRFQSRYEPMHTADAPRTFRDYSQGDGRGHVTSEPNRYYDSSVSRPWEHSRLATTGYLSQYGPEKWAKKPNDLPKFFGNDFGLSSTVFSDKFEKAVMCVSAIGLDEALARWMPSCLEGAVSTWYELELRVNHKIRTWPGFRKTFMAEFAPNYQNLLQKDFERRRQYSDETATGFIAAMDKYIEIIYPTADEQFKIQMILYKMNPKYRAAMSHERFDNLHQIDIVVYSESWEQHVEDLSDILTKLHCANFTVNPKKIKIGCDKINLLGHVVGQGQRIPDPEKVSALQNYPQPKNVKGIQRFLGAVGSYKTYVPNFSLISEPLTQLLRKDVKWIWGEGQENSFQSLKDAFHDGTSLALPDMEREFTLQCNASINGLSVTLSQEGDEGLRPVQFASRQLKAVESHYRENELQCLSVMFAVHKFLPFVEDAHFLIETDLRAVKEVLSLQETSIRVKRWQMRLMGMDCNIVDRKGNANTVADVLRKVQIPSIPNTTKSSNTGLVKPKKPELYLSSLVEHKEIPVTAAEWCKAQEKDSELTAIIDLVLAEDSHILASKYFVDADDVLKRQNISGSPQIVVPRLCRNAIIRSKHIHIHSEHFDVLKTYNKVKEKYTWKHMRANVKHYVKRCELCGSSKQEPLNVTQRSEESVFLSSRGTHSHYCY
ncbi:hypothetical protein B566_EDAN015410 [Ephemera danica]|nr:hypothetical protein B566_EDAN015410 [Ephemera danica]